MDSESQRRIAASSTHFSPTDLVCALRDSRGEPYPLAEYADPDTCFVTTKSKDGMAVRALEAPGLWNGSMARWNTVLIEVPAEIFNPVKTVLDLLRPAHRIPSRAVSQA